MRLRVVDAGSTRQGFQSSLISYVANDHIAFDAGALGLMPLDEQRKISTIFLSHSHADHIATLPLLIDNVYIPGPECITLYANQTTIDNLRQHVFNDRIWPNIFQLGPPDSPFVELKPLEHGQTVSVGDCRVTAFDVNHAIPTLGFVIEDHQVALAVVADTAPCDSIWELLSKFEKLRAVFLEISFPNAMTWLAEIAKHLTPHDFLAETRKLTGRLPANQPIEWFITHMKIEHAEAIAREVAELPMENYRFALGGECYYFK